MATTASPEAPQRQPPRQRTPLVLVLVVLISGTLISAWAIRGTMRNRGKPVADLPVAFSAPPIAVPAALRPQLVSQGEVLQRMQCDGCHSPEGRSIGPSYHEILARYQAHAPTDAALLGHLTAAVGHPQPGWDYFPPGPMEDGLTPPQRLAVAAWMVSLRQPVPGQPLPLSEGE